MNELIKLLPKSPKISGLFGISMLILWIFVFLFSYRCSFTKIMEFTEYRLLFISGSVGVIYWISNIMRIKLENKYNLKKALKNLEINGLILLDYVINKKKRVYSIDVIINFFDGWVASGAQWLSISDLIDKNESVIPDDQQLKEIQSTKEEGKYFYKFVIKKEFFEKLIRKPKIIQQFMPDNYDYKSAKEHFEKFLFDLRMFDPKSLNH